MHRLTHAKSAREIAQHMHAAETFDDGSDHLGVLRLIEQITNHGHEAFVVRVAQIRERGCNGGRIAIHQRDVRAALSESMALVTATLVAPAFAADGLIATKSPYSAK